MLRVENRTALYGYDNVLITTYNIYCISVSSSSLVVYIPSTRSSISCCRDLPVLYKNQVSSALRHSTSIFDSASSHRPPFHHAAFPAWRASTSTAFSSTPRPGSVEDRACSFRSAADPVSRPSSTYREIGAIAGTESAFS